MLLLRSALICSFHDLNDWNGWNHLNSTNIEPVAREQLTRAVTNRVSQFFTADSFKVEGKDPLVVRFLGERITYIGRTETERKPYQYRVTLRYMERTQQNPYGLVVSSVEQSDVARGL